MSLGKSVPRDFWPAKLIAFSFAAIFLSSCVTGIGREELATEYYNIGNDFYTLQEYGTAARYYQKAIDLNPDLAKAGYNLVRSFLELGDVEKSLVYLEEMIGEEPENPLLLETAAYAYFLAGKTEKSLEIYRALLDQSRYDADILYNYALTLEESGEREKAYEHLKEAIKLSPADEDILYGLARIARELNDNESAISYFSNYIEMNPDELLAKRLLADTYAEQRYFNKALTIYEEVLAEEKENAEVLFKKAEILLVEAGMLEEGMESLEAAIDAGFKDEKELEELLSREDLFNAERIEQLLQERGLLPVFEHKEPD